MIRSVHIIGSRTGGGAERFFVRLVQALAEAGHPAHAITRPDSAVAQLLGTTVPQSHVAMRNVYDWLSRRAIRRITDTLKPDIVQTYMGRATRLTHLPRHGGPRHVARLGNYYKLDGYRHAHAWIGNTRGICDYLVQGGLPAARVYHVPNFVDPAEPADPEELARLRSGYGIPAHARVVLGIGRFTPIKGFLGLVRALAGLPEIGGRPVYACLVGDGPQRQALEQETSRLGIAGRVRFAGWQSGPEAFFDLADVVAFPCRFDEPFGNVIIESWSHRRAVVATPSKGAQETSRHGETAWHADSDAPADLARALATVLGDEALRGALAAAGHAALLRDYARPVIVARYAQTYQHILDGGSG